jgi:hypothetical protein
MDYFGFPNKEIYYIVMKFDAIEPSLLGLHPRKLYNDTNSCQLSIDWQLRSNTNMDRSQYRICTYKGAGEFIDIETNEIYKPERGFYTASAWNEFRDKLEDQKR